MVLYVFSKIVLKNSFQKIGIKQVLDFFFFVLKNMKNMENTKFR